MKPRVLPLLLSYFCGIAFLFGSVWIALAVAATPPNVTPQPNGEMLIQQTTAAGQYFRIDASTDVQTWTPLVTLLSGGLLQYTNSAAPYFPRRFYRIVNLTGTGILTGDHLGTSVGDAVIHPVNHASFVMSWNGKMIYGDPVGAASLYSGFAKADLVLVTHSHSDHYSNTTLAAIVNTGAKIVAPQTVYNGMTAALKAMTTVMLTGQAIPANNTPPQTLMGVIVESILAYNANHPLGSGNGYVLNLGSKRIFLSGDTGDTPEMRALTGVDASFVCMNVPFTMTVTSAASVVRAFRPGVVYPHHYRNQDNSPSDLNSFKQQVGTDLGVEVRLRAWY